MGFNVIQDSDAESSDGSPPRPATTRVLAVKDSNVVQTLPAEQTRDEKTDPALYNYLSLTTESQVRSARTTMDQVQSKGVDPESRNRGAPGEKRPLDSGSEVEDELVLIPSPKRRKRDGTRPMDTVVAVAAQQLVTAGLDGSASQQELPAREDPDLAAQHEHVDLLKLGHGASTLQGIPQPLTPLLRNDLSFSSTAPSRAAYSASQQSGLSVAPAKWFPSPDSIGIGIDQNALDKGQPTPEKVRAEPVAMAPESPPKCSSEPPAARLNKDRLSAKTRPSRLSVPRGSSLERDPAAEQPGIPTKQRTHEAAPHIALSIEVDDGQEAVEVAKIQAGRGQADIVAETEARPKKRRGRPPKNQKAKPAADTPLEGDGAANAVQEARKPAPKKRGRKRKERTPSPPVESEGDEQKSDVEAAHKKPPQPDERERHNGSAPEDMANAKSSNHAEATPAKADASKDEDKENAPQSITPTKETTSKGSDKHSPIRNGKVPFRVGLSKRARIEPLLRIVKK